MQMPFLLVQFHRIQFVKLMIFLPLSSVPTALICIVASISAHCTYLFSWKSPPTKH